MPGQKQEDPQEDLNPELQNLLNSLDEEEVPPVPPVPPPSSTPKKAPPPPKVLQVATATPELPETPKPPKVDGNAIEGFLDEFKKAKNEIVDNIRADRAKIDTYIELYAQQVQGAEPRQVFVEGLANLVATQATHTANSVKILDAMTRMVAASKSVLADTAGGIGSATDLDKLLEEPFDERAA